MERSLKKKILNYRFYIITIGIITILAVFKLIQYQKPYLALTLVPIADLVDSPLQDIYSEKLIKDAYNSLPLYSKPNSICLRQNQLVFNEIVTIIKEKGDEVLIEIPNFFYLIKNIDEVDPSLRVKLPINRYWTLKSNLISLKKLQEYGLDITKLPPPISFAKKDNEYAHVVTLAMPFTDQERKITYSAGTRFIAAQNSKNAITVYIYDGNKADFILKEIPSHLFINPVKTHDEKIKQFVALVKRWAHLDNGFIPYVWRGMSFSQASYSQPIRVPLHDNKLAYEIVDFSYSPKSGFNCSGLICRAAQICGIPFFYRNSLGFFLDEVKPYESLEEGDLIWMPNHVMIISDMQKNLIVEARGYESGVGRVREVTINEIFKNIHSFEQLRKIIQKKHFLCLKIINQKINTIPCIKILKLSSAWNRQFVPSIIRNINQPMPNLLFEI